MPEDGQSTRRGPVLVVAGALAVLAAIVAVAAVSDLGPFGDDDTTASLTKAEFIAKGDEVCNRAHDQFAELQQEPPNSAEGAVALTQNLLRDLGERADRDPRPRCAAGGRGGAGPLPGAREQGIAVLERGLQAADDEDAPGYADAQAEIAAGQVRRLELAQAVGFSECSVVPTGNAGG